MCSNSFWSNVPHPPFEARGACVFFFFFFRWVGVLLFRSVDCRLQVSHQTSSTQLVLSCSFGPHLHTYTHVHTHMHTYKNQYNVVSSPGACSGPRAVVPIFLWSFHTEHPFIHYLSPLIALRVTCRGSCEWGTGALLALSKLFIVDDVGLVRTDRGIFL